jgi:dihydroneopterin aldolase
MLDAIGVEETTMDMNEQVMLIHPLVWRDEELRDVRALFLKDFVVSAHVGVYHQEEGRTQRLRFNLCVYLTPPFEWGDRLEDVLDYDRLRQGILDILAQGHIKLIETLGERIVDMCFAFLQIDGVHLQIVKLEAHDDCEVGYETRRRR